MERVVVADCDEYTILRSEYGFEIATDSGVMTPEDVAAAVLKLPRNVVLANPASLFFADAPRVEAFDWTPPGEDD
jgi:hypothetical protein